MHCDDERPFVDDNFRATERLETVLCLMVSMERMDIDASMHVVDVVSRETREAEPTAVES